MPAPATPCHGYLPALAGHRQVTHTLSSNLFYHFAIESVATFFSHPSTSCIILPLLPYLRFEVHKKAHPMKHISPKMPRGGQTQQPFTTEALHSASRRLAVQPQRDEWAKGSAKRRRGNDDLPQENARIQRLGAKAEPAVTERPARKSRRISYGDKATLPIDLTVDDADPSTAGTPRRKERVPTPFPGLSSPEPTAPTRSCIICIEVVSFHESVGCPCGHDYCRSCFRQLVRISMTDEAYFPPRCCQKEIPKSILSLVLPKEEWDQVCEKELEFSTPNRLYCHICAAFIKPRLILASRGLCQKCKTYTCVFCQKEMHGGECPKDLATAQLLEYAKLHKWQRCPKCRTMVEKASGCVYMSESRPLPMRSLGISADNTQRAPAAVTSVTHVERSSPTALEAALLRVVRRLYMHYRKKDARCC